MKIIPKSPSEEALSLSRAAGNKDRGNLKILIFEKNYMNVVILT